MNILKGTIERIVFENEENGYTIARLSTPEFSDLVTIVGNVAVIRAGESVLLEGFWVDHATYGRQFKIESYETILPATIVGLRRYLGSGLIKGIGPVMAARIVRKFGMETFDVIERTPEKLHKVKGIGSARIEMITTAWQAQREIKNVMIFLQSHNVSTSHAVKIYKTYENQSIPIVRENPYRLAKDIYGIGFKTADTIAQKLGFELDSPHRIREGIKYVLSEKADSSGHVFLFRDDLINSCEEMLGVNGDLIESRISELIAEQEIIAEQIEDREAIYLVPFYFCEVGVSNAIDDLLRQVRPEPHDQFLENAIDRIESRVAIPLSEGQRNAIRTAIRSPVMILTGGPGTGKTTTTIGLIALFEMIGKEILLGAPTGRAAKRLSETTKREAKTIHRLLEFSPQENGFRRDRENPLDADVVMIDEVSMVDIVLMHHLMKAVPKDATLILIGDVDQLPSVGAGNVLRDLINSCEIPTIVLTEIFRQAQESLIITNAHKINTGGFPDLNGKKDRDFFFIEQDEPETLAQTICDLATFRLPNHFDLHPFDDIQVLCPMRRSVIGSEKLNEMLQNSLNSNSPGQIRGKAKFRIGDKVMQIRNNYDLDVFNGDIGRIKNFDPIDRKVEVEYPEKIVGYDSNDLSDLVLSYAITVHKSQGSEYRSVILPLHTTHYMMLQRNLIYTAITRAKELVVIVGSKKALHMAIRNNKIAQRNSRLADRIGI